MNLPSWKNPGHGLDGNIQVALRITNGFRYVGSFIHKIENRMLEMNIDDYADTKGAFYD